MELRNTFDLNRFDLLDDEKMEFLLSFLRNRGNLKNIQSELQISYPAAKRRLDETLIALDLFEEKMEATEREGIDMRNWFTDRTSTQASEIIKSKLKENVGRVIVHTSRGLPCEICVAADGVSFVNRTIDLMYSILLWSCSKSETAAQEKAMVGTINWAMKIVTRLLL